MSSAHRSAQIQPISSQLTWAAFCCPVALNPGYGSKDGGLVSDGLLLRVGRGWWSWTRWLKICGSRVGGSQLSVSDLCGSASSFLTDLKWLNSCGCCSCFALTQLLSHRRRGNQIGFKCLWIFNEEGICSFRKPDWSSPSYPTGRWLRSFSRLLCWVHEDPDSSWPQTLPCSAAGSVSALVFNLRRQCTTPGLCTAAHGTGWSCTAARVSCEPSRTAVDRSSLECASRWLMVSQWRAPDPPPP